MEHLIGLNDRQKEAALHKNGPLLIIAGAGAGKTKTITHRILNLIKEGVRPENILAITFTNKAASEMRDRVSYQLKAILCQLPLVCTFHSLGVKIIKENHTLLGLPKHFTILDESDAARLVKEAVILSDLDPKEYEPRRLKNIISRQKGNFITREEFEQSASDYFSKIVTRVWQHYENLQKKEKSLDFDDLLLKTVLLLQKNPALQKIYQDRFKFLHVDEYQDTNQVQYELCRLLVGKDKNICVVGDSDQNVYCWRGATLKNILNFEHDYPGAQTVLLEENYRSTKNILEAANRVIAKNKERKMKNLFTRGEIGEKISLYEALDERDEADFVATKVLEIIDKGNSNENQEFRGAPQSDSSRTEQFSSKKIAYPENLGFRTALNNIAVLYRANFQSRAIEEALLAYNIPYQVIGTKFFERKEVKDVLSYLRAALNPDSLSDIKRIINLPARGIGKLTIVKLFSGQRANLPEKIQIKINSFYELLDCIRDAALNDRVSATIKYIIHKTGLEQSLKNGTDEDLERLENIKELVTLTQKYDHLPGEIGLEKLLEEAALMSDQDNLDEEKNGVKLMTVHAAKGLEFNTVFITGLEQDLFPHRRDDAATPEEAEEERRLFYVALTRAKKKLYLSFANSRTIFGSRQFTSPSEFLFDLPEELIEREQKQYLNLKSIYF